MESTLVLLKPDATARNLVGRILAYFEMNGLKVSRMRSVKYPGQYNCERHYQEHRGKWFFARNVEFLRSGLVIAVVISGEDAVRRVRDLVGATNPADAMPLTIRGKFGRLEKDKWSELPCNLVHASDSLDSSEREMLLWFPS